MMLEAVEKRFGACQSDEKLEAAFAVARELCDEERGLIVPPRNDRSLARRHFNGEGSAGWPCKKDEKASDDGLMKVSVSNEIDEDTHAASPG